MYTRILITSFPDWKNDLNQLFQALSKYIPHSVAALSHKLEHGIGVSYRTTINRRVKQYGRIRFIQTRIRRK